MASLTPSMTPVTIRQRLEATGAWQEARTGAEAIAAALDEARSAPRDHVDRIAFARQVVITGAGSSLYVAQIAAAAMRVVCGLPAVAVPLSEVLLRPRAVFATGDRSDQPLVVVSRSGTTTEALAVIREARKAGQPSLAVTCRPDSEMAALADATLAVPQADEAAIVMTRSFAALSTLLMRLGTRLGDPAFGLDLDRLPDLWVETAPHVEHAFDLAATDPTRVVVLGGGAAFGLANEAVLKLTETSRIPASAFHPLEFRHGPISVCEPGVVVIGILGGTALDEERRVIEESAALGATTWVLGPEGPGRHLGEIARLPLALHPLQALALGIAVRRGHDPERPRHLGRVVILADD
jgi:glucosamine--fructose-6-phosphate aminotransferase (isomerizing)